MSPTGPSSLELSHVSVTVQHQERLHNIDLDIFPGELFVLLGPAGAQKTTLLRAIAGLDPVASGEIRLDGKDITHVAIRKRGIASILECYPLWPNINVSKNIALPLKQQRMGRAEIQQRVEKGLDAVGLSEFAQHMPEQLSPGQQQRVALARTLAVDAKAHLLDQPFSAQGLQLHERLLLLLKRHQQQTGTTTLISTQDPTEALRLADRIAIMHNGEIQQIGSPRALYESPANRFVADYFGNVNLIDGEIEYVGDQPLFHAENGLVIPVFERAVKRSRNCTAMFRPQDVHIVHSDEEPFGDRIMFNGRIEQTEFRGDRMRYGVSLSGKTIWMDLARDDKLPHLEFGDQVVLAINPERIRILESQ